MRKLVHKDNFTRNGELVKVVLAGFNNLRPEFVLVALVLEGNIEPDERFALAFAPDGAAFLDKGEGVHEVFNIHGIDIVALDDD